MANQGMEEAHVARSPDRLNGALVTTTRMTGPGQHSQMGQMGFGFFCFLKVGSCTCHPRSREVEAKGLGVQGYPGLHGQRRDEEEVVRKAVCLCILSQLWRTQDPKGSEVSPHPV